MKISELEKKNLDYIAQVFNSPTFKDVDELKFAQVEIRKEVDRRVQEKVEKTIVIPILNKTYAIKAKHLGFVFKIVDGTKEGDTIIPIVKGFKTNSLTKTINVLDNTPIVGDNSLYKLSYSIRNEKLFLEYDNFKYDACEINENKYKDWCSFMGLYMDEKIFSVRE